MALVKAVMAGGLALSIAGAAAQAADPAYPAPTPTSQTQAAPANSTPPYSYGRLPGPKASGSNWIPPSAPRQSAANPNTASASYQQQ